MPLTKAQILVAEVELQAREAHDEEEESVEAAESSKDIT